MKLYFFPSKILAIFSYSNFYGGKMAELLFVIVLTAIPVGIGLFFVLAAKGAAERYVENGSYIGTERRWKKSTVTWIIFGLLSSIFSIFATIIIFYFAYLSYLWRGPTLSAVSGNGQLADGSAVAAQPPVNRLFVLLTVGLVLGLAIGYMTNPIEAGKLYFTEMDARRAAMDSRIHFALSAFVGAVIGAVVHYLAPKPKP